MPIMWIRESSPMTVVVESDDGRELGRMEIEGVQARNAAWQILEAEDADDAPVCNRAFRMQPKDGGEHVLKMEFRPGRP